MASPLVRAAWRVYRRSREKGNPVPDETRRIMNEYRRPGAREYQRKKRASYRHIPPSLFQALLDRGISAILINRNGRKLKTKARYLIVGQVSKDRHQRLEILHTDDETAILQHLSRAPYGAIVIDTKEIH